MVMVQLWYTSFQISGPLIAKLNNGAIGLPTDPLQIETISVSPDPPKPGANLTITVKLTIREATEEGAYVDTTVKLGLIKLLSKQFDLCREARNMNLSVQCPVQSGLYTVEHTFALPREIPPAKFTLSGRGYTVDEDDLLYADIKVDFMQL